MATLLHLILPQDYEERRKAIQERDRDVVVLAGAGTGKTTVLTQRFVERVAPSNDDVPAQKITRLAAVTFTRKAAGELKNRIRAELLSLLEQKLSPKREARVRAALSDLDFSLIGTIHSFSDRLLRLRPIEARISPAYEVVEDQDALVWETVTRWLQGAKSGNLRDQWVNQAKVPSLKACETAANWVSELQAADIKIRDLELEYITILGIEGLVRAWINQRDRGHPVTVVGNEVVSYSSEQVNRKLEQILNEIQSCLSPLKSTQFDVGAKHLRALQHNLASAIATSRLGEKIRWLNWVFKPAKDAGSPMTKSESFKLSATAGGWDLYKNLTGKPSKGQPNYREEIFLPLVKSLLAPAAEVQPTILALYEEVKSRHEVVDQLDLLLRLRDLLQRHKEVRDSLSGLFDHVFVDEFQDTDPIQAEILQSLCQKKGSLTIIGDPKQSIYRFRRADISIFGEVVLKLIERGALRAELSVNFRSHPGLIKSFNEVFPNHFGDSKNPDRKDFDPDTGWVRYSPLFADPNREAKGKERVNTPVGILRVDVSKFNRVDEQRPLEARLAARHIAWLLSPESKLGIQGKDIAVLTRAMTNIHLLARELRALGVPVHITGGSEFASSQVLQRYILALNAVADRGDGTATLAIHQFPFSSVTPFDAATQNGDDPTQAEGALRAWLLELRRQRVSRPVLHTALDVIEESLALRSLGLGLNAEEDLSALYRFANLMADTARENSWDFDEAARWARNWIDNPPQMNAPATESDDAIRIMSIHQSKGLEFPVVYLFDGFDREAGDRGGGFRISPDGKEWVLSIGGLSAEFNLENRQPSFKEREDLHIQAEQKRLHYVAATRAMNLLVVPVPEPVPKYSIYGKVWGGYIGPQAVDHVNVSEVTAGEANASHLVPYLPREEWLLQKEGPADISLQMAPADVATAASATSIPTTSVTGQTHSESVRMELPDEARSPEIIVPRRLESGGAELGTAVHRILFFILAGKMSLERSMEVVEAEAGDELDLKLLQGHVENAIQFLKNQGYLDGTWQLQSEMPFAVEHCDESGSSLMRGVIDLLLVRGKEGHIIDWKTDGDSFNAEMKGQYLKQVALYRDAAKRFLPDVVEWYGELVMTNSGRSVGLDGNECR